MGHSTLGAAGSIWSRRLTTGFVFALAVSTLDGVISPKEASAVQPPPPALTVYKAPGEGMVALAPGPDGNIWYTRTPNVGGAFINAFIGRVTPSGAITEFPTQYSNLYGITGGPDGNLWYTLNNYDRVAQITPQGGITEFGGLAPSQNPPYPDSPAGITKGPDGALWFTEQLAGTNFQGSIGRITTAGAITEYPLPATDGNNHLGSIITGPDGNLWFTAYIGNFIGRITPSGTITEFPIPSGQPGAALTSGPDELAAGPDANVWFTENQTGKIGRITPAGTITEFATGVHAAGIAAAADGNLWFTDNATGHTGFITVNGVITLFAAFPGPDLLDKLVAGPGATLWATDNYVQPDGTHVGAIAVLSSPTGLAPRYVALGDSYSSGEGLSPYIPPSDTNGCHRSLAAYPEKILGRPGVPSAVDFWACSGATIYNFYNASNGEPRQLDHLDSTATLISVGVGGNDINFDRIVRTCTDARQGPFGFFNPQSGYVPNCQKVLDADTTKLINGLTSGNLEGNGTYDLPALYASIRQNSPTARVFVVGYPNPLATTVSGDCQADIVNESGQPVGTGPWHYQFTIHKTDLPWLEKVISRLNTAIKTNAEQANFVFVNNLTTFQGHDVCGNSTDHWIHGVVVDSQNNPVEASFHPTATGQSHIADTLAAAIASPANGFVATVSPQQTVTQPLSVAPATYQLSVQSAWPGSDVQLSLVSPSGVVIGRATQSPGVIHQLQSNGESLAILSPEAGIWSIRLFGANVQAAGESVRVDTDQIPLSAYAPIAGISASTDRGVVPTSVQLNGSASTLNGAVIASYSWDFGDGTAPATGANQTHLFTTAGLHNVTLTVTDGNGQSDTATWPVYIAAIDQPPIASFDWGSLDSTAPSLVSFGATGSDDSDGQIASYSWNFGDGSSAQGLFTTHTYALPGTYPVTLTVTDNAGLTGSICRGVTTGAIGLGSTQACTTTNLTSNANPQQVGQPITLTATVASLPPATATPSGSITFSDGSAALGSVPLDSSGSALLITSSLSVGHHAITASYLGNATSAPSSAGLSQLVRSNEITFSSTRDGHLQIYLVNADGSQQTRLTSNPAADTEPVLSPTGTHVAFSSTRSGHVEIWVMNTAPESSTNAPINLTKNAAISIDPTWSPDGSKIAFASNRTGKFQIWVMNADGTGLTRLTSDSTNDVNPSWSPDGTRLAFASDASGRFQIYVANISLLPSPSLGTAARLTRDTGTDLTPAWSPDSQLIAFSGTASGSAEIWVINGNPGGVAVQETSHRWSLDVLPSWSPDGTDIAFTSGMTGLPQIFVIKFNPTGAGTNQVQLTNGAASAVANWCCVSAP